MTDEDDSHYGLYTKYHVEKLDDPERKHRDCFFFVLDIKHDPFAREALEAYAKACELEYPALAKDLRNKLREVHEA